MRVSVVNGNGAVCDVCGTLLVPDRIIRVQVNIPDPDLKQRRTGGRYVIGKMDVCEVCINDLLGRYLREPRRRAKK